MTQSPSKPSRLGPRLLIASGVVVCAAFAIALSVRNLTGHDLGYHLAYGDVFLSEGRIVDSGEFCYLVDPPVAPADQAEPGPGCWWDQAGRYRFPNANWLSQVLFSAVYSLGGGMGLVGLQAVLILLIFILAVTAARRMGAAWAAMPLLILLIGVTAKVRFGLRPEVPGFVMLLAQLALLGPLLNSEGPRDIGWKTAAGLIGLQVLFVNLHSYFLLGLALTGAVFVQQLIRLLLRSSEPAEAAKEKRNFRCVSLALAGQMVACFVNPWTWRLAVLPFQTVLFLREHDIAGSTGGVHGHPWAFIAEFFTPFSKGYLPQMATWGYIACLILAAAAGVIALLRRRWGAALILAGMTVVSLSMRRNIAPYSMIVSAVGLAMLTPAAAWAMNRIESTGRKLATGAQALVMIALAGLTVGVVSQQLYFHERKPERFDAGYSQVVLPVDAAQWFETHQPAGRLWTDYVASSNFFYFSSPHRTPPLLTNTWAYPPETMRMLLNVSLGIADYRKVFDRYDVQIVAVRCDSMSAEPSRPGLVPLIPRLMADPDWVLVHLNVAHLIFLRKDGPNAELAGREELTEGTFDAASHAEMLRRADPVEAYGLYAGATTLWRIGWFAPAERLYRQVLELEQDYHEAWAMLGVTLAELAARKGLAGRGELVEARQCLQRALALEPDHEQANIWYAMVERQLADVDRGVVWKSREQDVDFPSQQ
ncbi:MAG: tetratricopeptide repeat protein [Planctomycetota bacterium]